MESAFQRSLDEESSVTTHTLRIAMNGITGRMGYL